MGIISHCFTGWDLRESSLEYKREGVMSFTNQLISLNSEFMLRTLNLWEVLGIMLKPVRNGDITRQMGHKLTIFKNECHQFPQKSAMRKISYLKSGKNERDPQTQMYLSFLLLHSLNVYSSQGWTMSKPGNRSSIWISHEAVRTQILPLPLCTLAGRWESETEAGLEPNIPIQDVSH